MTVGQAQQYGQAELRAAGIGSFRLDTLLLLEKVLDKPRSWIIAHTEAVIDKKLYQKYLSLIKKRASRHPLVHLTNQREFYGQQFYINDQVLTPRVETEQMVEWAIDQAPKNGQLLDVGTGCGAIAIAIAKNRPDLTFIASDVSAEALKVARCNAHSHKVGIELVESDLFQNVEGKFDCICANLPYLPDKSELMPEVQKEPGIALFGGLDGLGLYQRFFEDIPQHLSAGGFLFTECDPWQQAKLEKMAGAAGLSKVCDSYFILGFQKI